MHLRSSAFRGENSPEQQHSPEAAGETEFFSKTWRRNRLRLEYGLKKINWRMTGLIAMVLFCLGTVIYLPRLLSDPTSERNGGDLDSGGAAGDTNSANHLRELELVERVGNGFYPLKDERGINVNLPYVPFEKVERIVMSMNDFETGINVTDRLNILRSIRASRAFLNPSAAKKHGIFGLGPDGKKIYRPLDPPSGNIDIAAELRRGGGFNMRLSDSLPLDRPAVDRRDPECKNIQYGSNLGQASVIIVFFNEPFSTLMRSVHSVLNLTPPSLLREIILVDDGSTLVWIAKGGSGLLEEYIRSVPKTILVRNGVRKGIVGARLAGIRAAKAENFVVLDSHIEVQPNWLEPLLSRLRDEPKAVLMPQVDGTDPETFENHSGGIGCTLGFLWKLIEHAYDPERESSTPERLNAKPTDVVSSPTMAGGLFAANKKHFLDMGGYDELFQYWGTENLELSFRLWMCGSRLECVPCSRVFHIFRKGGVGYSSPPDSTMKNKMRTMVLWMDEYADLAWRVLGQQRIDAGPYEQMQKWRAQKKCKSFQWYLKTVNPESFVTDLKQDVPYLGKIRNVGRQGVCLDHTNSDNPDQGRVSLYSCHGYSSQQWMYFSKVQHIMPVLNDEACLTNNNEPQIGWCHKNEQLWRIVDLENTHNRIRAPLVMTNDQDGSSTSANLVQIQGAGQDGRCLAATDDPKTALRMVTCDSADVYQQWLIDRYNPPKVFTPPPTS